MITYENEEEAYQRWMKNNQAGFVLNSPKQRSVNPHLMLHKASCFHIQPTDDRWDYTTGAYKKICSLSKQELIDWAKKTSSDFNQCTTCNP